MIEYCLLGDLIGMVLGLAMMFGAYKLFYSATLETLVTRVRDVWYNPHAKENDRLTCRIKLLTELLGDYEGTDTVAMDGWRRMTAECERLQGELLNHRHQFTRLLEDHYRSGGRQLDQLLTRVETGHHVYCYHTAARCSFETHHVDMRRFSVRCDLDAGLARDMPPELVARRLGDHVVSAVLSHWSGQSILKGDR